MRRFELDSYLLYLKFQEISVRGSIFLVSYLLIFLPFFSFCACTFLFFGRQLALLLHQELNSSPRVPRVPRARHGGSLPQLTSPSAASMLIKRTSSAGGKDHCLVGFMPSFQIINVAFYINFLSRSLQSSAKRLANLALYW